MHFRHQHTNRLGGFAQYGRGFGSNPFRRNPYIQHGAGFGNILRSIVKASVPALKFFGQQLASNQVVRNVGTSLKRSALQGVQELAKDVLAGKNIKQSFNNSLAQARRDVAATVKAHAANKSAPSTAGGEDDLRVVKAAKRKAPRIDRWKRRTPVVRRSKGSLWADDDSDGGTSGGGGEN